MSTYREHPSLSQSFLKSLEGHPKYANIVKKSKAFDIGNLVDTLLTDNDNFYNIYAVYEGNVPSEKMKLLADRFVEIALYTKSNGEAYYPDNIVLQARADVEYDSRLSAATILKKFAEDASDYTDFCIGNYDKQVVSAQDNILARQLANSCKQDFPDWFIPTDYVEIMFQQELYFEYDLNNIPIECKALPDVIRIDHINRTIEIADVKTYADDFVDNYWKYRYYYQAEYYLYAIVHFLNDINIPKDYTVKDFYFIAIDKSGFKGNLLYKHNSNYRTTLWSGGRMYDNKGKYIKLKGLKQLIKEYYYHSSTGNWDYPYEYLNKGYILL